MKKLVYLAILLLSIIGVVFFCHLWFKYFHENRVLKEIIARLEADTRIAEVLVTGVNYDEFAAKTMTTIKFLEYDAHGNSLKPRYFTFAGNIIQFQSFVIRFEDIHIRRGDKLRGKSAYLFWKVFMLDGANTREYEITKVGEIPAGYKVENTKDTFEERLWAKFWEYALRPEEAKKMGIKNAQIEAPGTMFIPGTIYTIKIEHDGGLRIDSSPLPSILRGEQIPK
ncbi:MAG: hypothetical protein PHE61_05955 [Candidatus Omnitrophica bacterium]|nr:hypothetical protein [Candidatus Omnitrophota bacterium]